MTVQIQCCIFIPSCFIWLALSNQIASAKKIIYLIEEKNENFQIDTNGKEKHDLALKNAFREDLRGKFHHYRHYNNQQKPKTQLIKQFNRKHQILDDKQMINSSMNNLNLPPLNQNNHSFTGSQEFSAQ